MHHEVDYSKIEGTEATKRKLAVADIKDYMGTKRFNSLNKQLAEFLRDYPDITLEHFERMLVLLPISGYPIKAWYETLKGV